MTRTEPPVIVPYHPRRCTWCGELVSSTSLPVVAEGFVFHAVCFDSHQDGGEGACWECGYPFVSPRPERTPSCRCHEATAIYERESASPFKS